MHVTARFSISFLFMANNIPLYGYITFCLAIHQLMDIGVIFTIWLLRTMLLWILVYMVLCEHPFSFLLVEEWKCWVGWQFCLTFWGTARLFRSDYTILCFHQQCLSVLLFPHSHQHLLFSGFCWFALVAISVGVKWYLRLVLTALPWRIMTLNIFAYIYWAFVYLLWRNDYSSSLPTFNWVAFDRDRVKGQNRWLNSWSH